MDIYVLMVAKGFKQLLWQEQKKLSSKSICGARFHPMIIRFCLSLSQKSASSYDEFGDTFDGVIKLPSSRTLRDYKNQDSLKELSRSLSG